eukprot:scaffold3577_cov414-Prasinococcus_capsulatus_cf.AAC.10
MLSPFPRCPWRHLTVVHAIVTPRAASLSRAAGMRWHVMHSCAVFQQTNACQSRWSAWIWNPMVRDA